MQKLILAPQLLPDFVGVGHQLELCDPSGQTVGYFMPLVEYSPELYAWARVQISDDELNRRKLEPDGRSTAEVVERLSAL